MEKYTEPRDVSSIHVRISINGALNFGLSEEKRFVSQGEDGIGDFSKVIAFKDVSDNIRYLSDVLPKVLSIDTWHVTDRSDFD